MSGQPLTGPSMISFLEGGVVKIFWGGGGGQIKEGVRNMEYGLGMEL